MLSFNVFMFLLIIPYCQSNIYLKEMNDYVDMAMGILNDSSEHDSTGKFIKKPYFFFSSNLLLM
jgi:hypothetical protein